MSKYKGLTGLANLGNTCYINSCIQVLSHTHELYENISNITIKNSIDNLLLTEWKKLHELMWQKNCIISPNGFIKSLHKYSVHKKNEEFSGYDQNDVSEFLIFMLDSFHNSLSREVNMKIKGNIINNKDKMAFICYQRIKEMQKNDYSELIELFYGIHVSQILDHTSKKKILSISVEPSMIIHLPIPKIKNPDIYDCFNLYTESEELTDDNMWFNEKTNKKQNVYKKNSFWSLPNILIVDLMRFSYFSNKNNTLVNVPVDDIDLSKYIEGYDKSKYIYELYGICNHHGRSQQGGHYTAVIKILDKWYIFDDTTVKETQQRYVVTQKAYVLFFRRKKVN